MLPPPPPPPAAPLELLEPEELVELDDVELLVELPSPSPPELEVLLLEVLLELLLTPVPAEPPAST